MWDVFGGHVEPHEELREALVRELREELGITPTQFTKLTVLHAPPSSQHGAYEVHMYCVTDWIGTPQNLVPDEHADIRWFSFEHTQQLELALPEYHLLLGRLARSGTMPE